MPLRLGLATAALLCLLPAATASAVTTVSVSERFVEGYKGSGTTYADLLMEGDGGPSALRAVREPGAVVLREPTSGARPGVGCVEIPEEPGVGIRCAMAPGAVVGGIVRAGGGDDRLDLQGVFDGITTVEAGPGDDTVVAQGALHGGPGDDELRGSEDEDVLDGGPGRDLLDGGDGDRDLVDYRARTQPVSVDLGAGSGGERDEGDRLTRIEGVYGGGSDDVLIGSDGDDVLEGFAGDDLLEGGSGNDRLGDGKGGAVLLGGPGADRLDTKAGDPAIPTAAIGGPPGRHEPPGAGRMDGGAGGDLLVSGAGRDAIVGGADGDRVEGVGRGDRVRLRDGRGDRVDCNPISRPAARVAVDAADLALGCRRIERSGAAAPRLVSVGGFDQENGGELAIASVGCSDDQRPACRGSVRVVVGGRQAGRRRFAVPAGEVRDVRFRLAPSVAQRLRRRESVALRYEVFARDGRGRVVRLTGRQRLCFEIECEYPTSVGS